MLFTAELAVALEEKPDTDTFSWSKTWSSSGSKDSSSSNSDSSSTSSDGTGSRQSALSSSPPLGKAALQRVALNALQVFAPVAETLGVRGPLRSLEASAYRVSVVAE